MGMFGSATASSSVDLQIAGRIATADTSNLAGASYAQSKAIISGLFSSKAYVAGLGKGSLNPIS
jgi:hypothetical protein